MFWVWVIVDMVMKTMMFNVAERVWKCVGVIGNMFCSTCAWKKNKMLIVKNLCCTKCNCNIKKRRRGSSKWHYIHTLRTSREFKIFSTKKNISQVWEPDMPQHTCLPSCLCVMWPTRLIMIIFRVASTHISQSQCDVYIRLKAIDRKQ